MKAPELLAPAGSFLSAYYAFEGGADGVYLGMKEFSARASASNFTLEQLRRIRQLAADRGKRVYVTVNTIVTEEEMPRLETTLAWLEALGVDGIIVQDLGVCALLRRRFPGLPVHASTQMAVHNDEGIRVAESLGIRRVILSREVPLAAIEGLRARHPGIELEVFIHGALCYSFSGACLASTALTGRSGNRGECAQICRSLFRSEEDEGGPDSGAASASAVRAGASGAAAGRGPAAGTTASTAGRGPVATASGRGLALPGCGHYFSCRDLFLDRDVLALAKVGVDSLKIEGRMKAPEYVLAVTRLYRALLDRGDALGEAEHAALVRAVELAFAREKTSGWLRASSGSRLIQHEFPGHRGALLGRVSAVKGRRITLRIEGDLSLRDGLGFFTEEGRDLAAFSVQGLRVRGREVRFARAGEEVSIDVPPLADPALPSKGDEIRQLSSRFLDLPQPKEAGFPLYRILVDLEVALDRGGVLTARTAGLETFSTTVTVDAATRRRPFIDVLRSLLGESGDSLLRLGELSFVNTTGLPDDGIFVPPSELKKAKNDLFAALERSFTARVEAGPRRAAASAPAATPRDPSEAAGIPPATAGAAAMAAGAPTAAAGAPPAASLVAAVASPASLDPAVLAVVAHRELLNPPSTDPIPFVPPGPWDGIDGFAERAGYRWLPLPPVMMERGWTDALRALATSFPSTRFAVGLNNVAHVAIAEDLSELANVSFFVDFSLYVANTACRDLLATRVPRLLFAYAWLEGKNDALAAATTGIPVVRVAPGFRPPLFYSLGCLVRHVGNRGACLDECPRFFTARVSQGRSRFDLVVRDCVTYLFVAR